MILTWTVADQVLIEVTPVALEALAALTDGFQLTTAHLGLRSFLAADQRVGIDGLSLHVVAAAKRVPTVPCALVAEPLTGRGSKPVPLTPLPLPLPKC